MALRNAFIIEVPPPPHHLQHHRAADGYTETTEEERKRREKRTHTHKKEITHRGLGAHWSVMRVRLHAPWRSGASANGKSRRRHLFWYPSVAGGNVAHEKAIHISSSRVVVVRDFRVRAFFHSLILRLLFLLISSPLSQGKQRWIKLFFSLFSIFSLPFRI